LTALALKQGGYDWGLLAFAVGFGGSMIWFGSSAGVALSNLYPEAKSVGRWVRYGWHVALAYVIGFFVFMLIAGWYPTDKRGQALITDVTPVVEWTPSAEPSRSEEHTSELQSRENLVCRLLLEKKKKTLL